MSDGPAVELARAKVNLALHVTGQREDGYHLLDSLVVFADIGDRLTVERADRTSLSIFGPFGDGLSADGDNLVLKAVALMHGAHAAILLEKYLPTAAGLGGGSADAAAALRALAGLYGSSLPPVHEALSLGADVPVCLSSRPVRMRGVGEVIDPAPGLPPFWLVLANPGVPLSTPEAFKALRQKDNPGLGSLPVRFADLDALTRWLRTTRNDLEPGAFALCPPARAAKTALERLPGCRIARMSGSGATAWGMFATEQAALDAATALRAQEPHWWVAAAPLA